MQPVWLTRERELSHKVLVLQLDDYELAAHYGVSVGTIRNARELFNLPKNAKPREPVPAGPAPRSLPFTTYEENGMTIKRYQAGYALGAISTPFTVRTRR